jgi:hypothetical protein
MTQMDGQRAQQYYGLSTSVVVPALNEAQNLQAASPAGLECGAAELKGESSASFMLTAYQNL